MVANAHHEPDPEETKISDLGYLVGVIFFVILLTILPLLQFSVHGIPEIGDCQADWSTSMSRTAPNICYASSLMP